MRVGSVLFKGRQFTALFEGGEARLVDKPFKRYLEEGGEAAESVPLGEIAFLPPVPDPQKIVCVGLNYREHAQDLIAKKTLDNLPNRPVIFLKPPSALTAHGQSIIIPKIEGVRVEYEAELAVVIGRKCKGVKAPDAGKFIFGYTCLNDVTARNLQKEDGQWTRAKSFDSFAPFGPWIETGVTPDDLEIKCVLNGEVVQQSSTKNMIFNVPKVIEFVSEVMTLEPGDVISTGTPAGAGQLKKGDVVRVEIEKIGALENSVI